MVAFCHESYNYIILVSRARIGKLVHRPVCFLPAYQSPFIGLTFIYCLVSIDIALEAVKVFGWPTQGYKFNKGILLVPTCIYERGGTDTNITALN